VTGGGPGGDERAPLARLFAMALRSTIDELHERLDRRGWPDMRPTFGFALLAVSEGDATVVSLAGLLGVTKQAASKLVASMEEIGYVQRSAHAADGRAKAVTLTPRGAELLAAVEEVYAEIEAEWAAVLGAGRVASLRHDLLHVLRATHGGTLPAVRPTW
jgi:DNA-binding MarR family transcriptional regulator